MYILGEKTISKVVPTKTILKYPDREETYYKLDTFFAVADLSRQRQNNFKGWKDNLLIGTLRDKSLYRVVLNGSEVSGIERINIEIRSRDILESSKGVFILEDSNPPNIWEMTPSN